MIPRLTVVAIAARYQTGQIRSSQPWVGQPKFFFALLVELARPKNQKFLPLTLILLQSRGVKRWKLIQARSSTTTTKKSDIIFINILTESHKISIVFVDPYVGDYN